MRQVSLVRKETRYGVTEKQAEAQVYLGLGANLGEPRTAFIRTRAALVQHPQIWNCSSSALYRTPALGGPTGQPDYLNAVLSLQTSLTPRELLHLCQGLELAEGRERKERWGPRTLDIDLLFYADRIIEEADLTVPHPRLQERLFVLLPLADLAPDLRHPLSGQTIKVLIEHLPVDEQIRMINPNW